MKQETQADVKTFEENIKKINFFFSRKYVSLEIHWIYGVKFIHTVNMSYVCISLYISDIFFSFY